MSAPVSRRFAWRGENLVAYQDGHKCWVEDFDGMTYARLSCELIEHAPAEGKFTLRWWAENQALCEFMADEGILKTEGTPYVVSTYVATMDAYLVPEVAA